MSDRLVAVVPVHNGGLDIDRCLAALRTAGLEGEDIVVVDDASSDGAARRAAEKYRCHYLPPVGGQSRPRGPACARNRGAGTVADAELLVFVDADVSVHDDAISRFRHLFEADRELAGAFGSYDERPTDRGWISRYKNLLHHHMHQGAIRPASTFWSGCGAVRTAAFTHAGGFDESITGASIEDIELGMRLHEAGERIELHPEILCTHHKRWTLRSWLRTDIFGRALPWSRLLVSRGGKLPDTLNLGQRERITALVVCLVPLVLLLLPAGGAPAGLTIGIAAILTLAYGWLQRGLFGFFADRGGTAFALAASALHFIYYLYATASYLLVRLRLA